MTPARTLSDAELTELADWLDGALPPHSGPLTIAPYPQQAGNSHLVFRVRTSSHVWAMRVAPLRDSSGGYDLSREFSVLQGLSGSPVPHPSPVLCAASPGCPIDRDLLVCDWVHGHTLVGPLPAAITNPGSGEKLAWSLVETLADIHDTAVTAPVLDRPRASAAEFLDRQFEKGRAMLDHHSVRDVDHLTRLLATLSDHRPARWHCGLMHGDYSAMNVMIHDERTPTVSCVLDWETATVGATMVDLGYLSARWATADMDPLLAAFALGAGDPDSLRALPPRDFIDDAYQAITGRSCRDLPFFQGLGMARLALAVEVRVARAHRQGQHDRAQGFARLVDTVVAHGLRLTDAG